MKPFETYQYLEGFPMTERDKQEVGSKFWNQGKWDNFILPFLPNDCSEMSLVDMGCNAGLFLKLAEDKGFDAIGIDSNANAIKRAVVYKERVSGCYDIQRRYMDRSINHLPVVDYTILANSHYYFDIDKWLDYVNKLQIRTRYCIIVTTEKHRVFCKASSDLSDIRSYFKNWSEVGFLNELPLVNDPKPRRLWGLCFKSPVIDRVTIDSLDNGNRQQSGFYAELDKGRNPLRTRYYARLKSYRLIEKRQPWKHERIVEHINHIAELYDDIKHYGMKDPIIINSTNRILDGNHRCAIMKHLGFKTILVWRV